MRIKLAAITAALAAMIAPMVVVTPAEAYGIRCVAARPNLRSDGTMDLFVQSTNTPHYTGRPFAHWLYIQYPAQMNIYKWPTAARSMRTGKPPYGGIVVKARAWQSGRECATWTGSFYTIR